jgi:hypothetical protein
LQAALRPRFFFVYKVGAKTGSNNGSVQSIVPSSQIDRKTIEVGFWTAGDLLPLKDSTYSNNEGLYKV